jgi:NADH-quinone oxidoreductase subunit J
MSALATLPIAATLTGAEWAEFVAFVILAPTAVGTALAMIFNRNAIHAALLLVVNLFCLAVFYLMLQAQFVFVVQIAVYAGAIMVLFLFVLMLLGVDRRESLVETIKGQRVMAAGLGVLLLAGVIAAVLTGVFPSESAGLAAANAGGNVEAIGRLLFTRYTLAFEATGVLLLVAGVAALVLARPERGASARLGGTADRREPVGAGAPDGEQVDAAAEPAAKPEGDKEAQPA